MRVCARERERERERKRKTSCLRKSERVRDRVRKSTNFFYFAEDLNERYISPFCRENKQKYSLISLKEKQLL